VADPWVRLSEEARLAWAQSPLGDLSARATAYVLQGAVEDHLPDGSPLPPGAANPGQDTVLLLVVSGLIRTYRRHGVRQVTTRYAEEGDFVGVPSAIRHGSSANGEVVSEAHIVRMVASRLRELVRHDASAAWVVMRELVHLHDTAVAMTCDNVFLTVRQRVAVHLLDLAVRESDGLVVYASHQNIADAIGSVREVVSRVLRELKAEGLVDRAGERILLSRPPDLHRLVAGGLRAAR